MAWKRKQSSAPASPASEDVNLGQGQTPPEEAEMEMDKGLQAWLQVLGSWLLFANTWYAHLFPKLTHCLSS